MKINVIGVKKYDFEDKNTQKRVKGINLFYTYENQLDENLIGKMSGKINLGEKSAERINSNDLLNDLLNARYCDADFDNYGKLLSIQPCNS